MILWWFYLCIGIEILNKLEEWKALYPQVSLRTDFTTKVDLQVVQSCVLQGRRVCRISWFSKACCSRRGGGSLPLQAHSSSPWLSASPTSAPSLLRVSGAVTVSALIPETIGGGGGTSQLQWTELLGGALAEHCRQARLGREGAGRALWEAEQELWAPACGLGFREGVGPKAKTRQGCRGLSDCRHIRIVANIWRETS